MHERTGGGTLGKPYEHCRILGPREVVDGGHVGLRVSLGLLGALRTCRERNCKSTHDTAGEGAVCRIVAGVAREEGAKSHRQEGIEGTEGMAKAGRCWIFFGGRAEERPDRRAMHVTGGWGWSSPFGGVSAAPARSQESKLSTASQSLPVSRTAPGPTTTQFLRGPEAQQHPSIGSQKVNAEPR